MTNTPSFLLRLRASLRERGGMRAILSNMSWLLADRLVRMLLGLLVGAWVARYLGPVRFGELSYALTLCAFFQILTQLGLDGLVVRDIARDGRQAGIILGTVLRLRMMTGVMSWLLSIGFFYLLRPHDSEGLLLMALVGTSLIFIPAETFDLWFQSQVQSRRSVLAKTSAYVLAAVAKSMLILFHAPLWVFALMQTLDLGLAALFLYLSYRRFPVAGGWGWSRSRAISLLRESWPFWASALFTVTYVRIDQIMLRAMVGERELGIYSAVLPFSQAWSFVPVLICASLLPSMSRLHRNDPAIFHHRLQLLFTGVFWVAVALVVFMSLAADFVVNTLLGHQYAEAVEVLRVHVIANLFIFLGVAQGQWILNERKGKLLLAKGLIGVLAGVTANFLLIRHYGALGSAMSAVIAQASAVVLCNAVFAPQIFRMQMSAMFPVYLLKRSPLR